ncbi:hypothetical protein, partial [Paenibacillus timonensis]
PSQQPETIFENRLFQEQLIKGAEGSGPASTPKKTMVQGAAPRTIVFLLHPRVYRIYSFR